MTKEEVQDRRGKNKFFKHIDELGETVDRNPVFSKLPLTPDGQVIIHHYFRKSTKDYWIIGDYSKVLYMGKMLYKHGELPFKVGQYYEVHNCIYGQ
jgi:hypothetical protein